MAATWLDLLCASQIVQMADVRGCQSEHFDFRQLPVDGISRYEPPEIFEACVDILGANTFPFIRLTPLGR